ncbi:MAG: hypothetical protein C5B57_04970 [Blastocatellia bacterium]|nr:MAG: hypothetical protein C5B57_04970 [Blastocatellia bacterium]
MAPWRLPEMSPWRRHALTIPPNSLRAWVSLAVWELWMGALVCAALGLGGNLIVTAPRGIITVRDFSGCDVRVLAAEHCGNVVYTTGGLSALFSVLFGIQLIVAAAWLVWELWTAVESTPITDDFLKLLHDSFGHDWRRPRTWPWMRLLWAYGFTLPGAASALVIWILVSTPFPAKITTAHVETSQSFRLVR